MDRDRHETYSMDLRGRRTLPVLAPRVTEGERSLRFFGVWHALTVRHLLVLKRQGRSTLEAFDGHGGRTDPVAIDAAIATIGVWLKDCSDLESYALALELLLGAVPVEHGHRPENPRRPRPLSRCDLLQERFGGAWYERRYHAVVGVAYRKIERRMNAAGVLG